MAGMGLLHDRLHGKVWHTTEPAHVPSIVELGAILVKPPVAGIWRSICGESQPSFVKKIGGVSLFDFRNFNPDAYSETYPMSNWRTFVPHLGSGAVWIEIETESISLSYITPDELVNLWKQSNSYRNAIMPRIEAANVGDVTVSSLRSAFIVWDNGQQVREFDVARFSTLDFQSLLQEWKSNTI